MRRIKTSKSLQNLHNRRSRLILFSRICRSEPNLNFRLITFLKNFLLLLSILTGKESRMTTRNTIWSFLKMLLIFNERIQYCTKNSLLMRYKISRNRKKSKWKRIISPTRTKLTIFLIMIIWRPNVSTLSISWTASS